MKAKLLFLAIMSYLAATQATSAYSSDSPSASNSLRFLESYPHAVNLNQTQWGYMLDLEFAIPMQWRDNDTFIVSTMTSSIVTAASNCTDCIEPWPLKNYNMSRSTTVKTNGT